MRKTCRSLFVFLFAIMCTHTLKANSITVLKDTLTEEQKDSIHEATLQATMSYPYIKSSKESGVLPVQDIDEKQDPNLQYKLLFFLAGVDKNKMKKRKKKTSFDRHFLHNSLHPMKKVDKAWL